jgi:hypothetical protein
MTKTRKLIAAAVAAIAVAGGSLALSSDAEARGMRGGHGFHGKGFHGKWHGHRWHGHRWHKRWHYGYGFYAPVAYGGCTFVKKYTRFGPKYIKVCPDLY